MKSNEKNSLNENGKQNINTKELDKVKEWRSLVLKVNLLFNLVKR